MTKEPFKKHFKEMIDDYENVHIVDLLKDNKERESRLTKEYYKLFFESDYRLNEKLKFLHFDMHSFIKGDKY